MHENKSLPFTWTFFFPFRECYRIFSAERFCVSFDRFLLIFSCYREWIYANIDVKILKRGVWVWLTQRLPNQPFRSLKMGFRASGMCINLIFSRALKISFRKRLKWENEKMGKQDTASVFSSSQARKINTRNFNVDPWRYCWSIANSHEWNLKPEEFKNVPKHKKGLWMAMNERLRSNEGIFFYSVEKSGKMWGMLGAVLSFQLFLLSLSCVRSIKKHSCKKLCIHAYCGVNSTMTQN